MATTTSFLLKHLLGSALMLSSNGTAVDSSPDLAPISPDTFVVVHQANVGGDHGDIVGDVFKADPGGSLVPIKRDIHINADSQGDQVSPRIARLSNGTFVVAWASGAGPVAARRLSADGMSTAGTDIMISEAGELWDTVRLFAGPGNNCNLYWELWNRSLRVPALSHMSRVLAPDDSLSPKGNSVGMLVDAIELRDGGHSWLTEHVQSFSLLRTVPGDGTIGSHIAIVHGYSLSDPSSYYDENVRELLDGRTIVAFERSDGTERDIAAYLMDARISQHAPIGPASLIIPNGPGMVLNPEIAVLSSGHTVVSWISIEGAPLPLPTFMSWKLRANVYDPSVGMGRVISGEVLASGNIFNAPVNYSLLPLGSSKLIAAFDNQPNGSQLGILINAFGLMRVTNGDSANDRIVLDADDLDDDVRGGAGDDWLDGGPGRDLLDGGPGADTYVMTESQDKVQESGPPADTSDTVATTLNNYKLPDGVENLIGYGPGPVPEQLRLVPGIGPLVWGGNYLNNTIDGTRDLNIIFGNGGQDVISGYGGNDGLFGGTGNDLIFGGDGDDRIGNAYPYSNFPGIADPGSSTSTEQDEFVGGDGNDVFIATASREFFIGGTGVNASDSSPYDTVTYEFSGTPIILNLIDDRQNTGFAAGDKFDGIEQIFATPYSDTLSGNGSNQSFDGRGGDDTLVGYAGSDTLSGGDGNDRLYGGVGTDYLEGGPNNDTMTGGADADRFAFAPGDFGDDVIADFEDGKDRLATPLTFADFIVTRTSSTEVVVSLRSAPANRITIKSASPITIDAADFVSF